MADPAARPPDAPSFDLQIHRGHRAVDGAPGPPPDSPPRPGRARPPRSGLRARVQGGLKILLVVAAAAAAAAWILGQPPQGALARVNGEYLTAAQVDREILINRVFASLSADAVGRAETRSAVLERLITQRIEAQAVSRTGMTVTDADLDGAITNLSRGQHWTATDLDAALARQGITRADLRTSLHDVLLVTRYADQVLAHGAGNSNQAAAAQTTWAQQVVQASQVTRYGDPNGANAPRPGASAPDFTLLDADGRIVSLATFRGHPVLLNFWATWCQPCRAEMPLLRARYAQAQATGGTAPLVVLAVATNSAPDTVAAFRKEFGLPFPVVRDADLTVLTRYRVGPIPTSFLIDRQGVIRWVQVGTWSDALLSDKLQLTP